MTSPGGLASLRSSILVEHVGLRRRDLIVERLKMQPSDEIIANMFETIACRFIGQHLRLQSRGLDLQLYLTATLECDEPKSGIVDAMAACGEQSVVLMKHCAVLSDFRRPKLRSRSPPPRRLRRHPPPRGYRKSMQRLG